MILNERKIKILEAIVNDYIANAEPIGSRTIAKKYDLGISSATIRNEMSDLEELGLIVQPHTSSGRVPSDKGYRLYVDKLMNYRELTNEETRFLKDIISNNINQVDFLMQQTAKALSILTKYTTVVSEPKSKRVSVKHVQLVPLDEKSVVVVVVTEDKVIKNHVMQVNRSLDIEELNNISGIINSSLKNYKIENVQNITIGNEYSDIISDVFNVVAKTIMHEEDIHLYTSGVNNILDFPEFSDIEKAKNIFQALEEKEALIDLLGIENSTADDKLQIFIGYENSMEQLKDCSIIKTKYNIGNAVGTIGIIGPTRMDYSQTVMYLNGIVKNINDVIKTISGG